MILIKNKVLNIIAAIIVSNSLLYSQQVSEPKSSNTFSHRHVFTAQESYLAATAIGEYSSWLGCGHTNIQKPFIYVEGENELIMHNF